MDEIVPVHAAKTHLSQLLARVEAGEVITIARGRTPVAKLVPIAPKAKREFGAMRGKSRSARSFSSPYRRTSSIAGVNNGCDCCSIPMR
jgi:prevent-host-death family protein